MLLLHKCLYRNVQNTITGKKEVRARCIAADWRISTVTRYKWTRVWHKRTYVRSGTDCTRVIIQLTIVSPCPGKAGANGHGYEYEYHLGRPLAVGLCTRACTKSPPQQRFKASEGVHMQPVNNGRYAPEFRCIFLPRQEIRYCESVPIPLWLHISPVTLPR